MEEIKELIKEEIDFLRYINNLDRATINVKIVLKIAELEKNGKYKL